MKYIIGIDVGGTNTDLVIIDEADNILFSKKILTKDKAFDGILELLLDVFKIYSVDLIKRIVIGTTSSLNNILERKNLEGVGLIRLSKGSEDFLPPCFGWPNDLKKIILKKYISVEGGFECDGREICPLNILEIKKIGRFFLKKNIKKIVINSPFSHLFNAHEILAVKALEEFYDKEDIEVSHKFHDIGFIERENTLLLNAALKNSFFYEFSELKQISETFNIPFFLVQNNGTLLSFEEAIKSPVKTIGAGVVNSCIGGSKLALKKDAIVVDVGGTSSDIGIVKDYFCKKSNGSLSLGGIELLEDSPDIHSIALGGGTLIEEKNNVFRLGIKSIGKKLFQDGYSFGGKFKTLTDASIVCDIFKSKKILKKNAFNQKDAMNILNQGINKLFSLIKKINIEKFPIVLVGGGSVLFDISNFEDIIIPPYSDVANAYGAACAEFCTSIIISKSIENKDEVLAQLHRKALEKTLLKGAKEARIIEQKLIPYSYIPGNIFKIIVVAAGR